MEYIVDLPYLLRWYAILTLIGLCFLPLSGRLFAGFLDKGYAFSKIVGIVCISLTLWTLAYLHILPISGWSIVAIVILFFGLNVGLAGIVVRKRKNKTTTSFDTKQMLDSFMPSSTSKTARGLIFAEEALFIFVLLGYAWIRGHEPSIHGLEKFMDLGFINAVLTSTYLPAQDMWLSPINEAFDDGLGESLYTQGFYINYYYFGHFTTAVLTLLSGIRSDVTYNLMLLSTFALSALGAFGIGATLIGTSRKYYDEFWEKHKSDHDTIGKKTMSFFSRIVNSLKQKMAIGQSSQNKSETPYLFSSIVGGLLTACLVTLSGNLHTIYIFTTGYTGDNPVPFWQIWRPLQDIFSESVVYWYPNATRFIPNTIHEFPSYSWVVADLHGHVLDIPFVLLTLALLFSYVHNILSTLKTTKPTEPNLSFGYITSLLRTHWHIMVIGTMTGVMYMTNAWDGLIYLGLSAVLIAVVHTIIYWYNFKSLSVSYWVFMIGSAIVFVTLALSFIATTFTFNLSFKPFASSIGVVGGWELLSFLGLIDPFHDTYSVGPLLFEKGNNLRSPLWMLGVLWGFFLFFISSFVLYIVNMYKTISRFTTIKPNGPKGFMVQTFTIGNIFIAVISIVSIGLILFPEFFYAKDIYPGHYRANTMFKLGYQAFIMLSIVSAYTIFSIISVKKVMIYTVNLFTLWKAITIMLLVMVLIYPYFAFDSYYLLTSVRHTNPNPYKSLDGTAWLRQTHPDDYAAIAWFKSDSGIHERRSEIRLVEAVGDSYTDYGRFSVHTGLPTVLGWPVHEWLWRGSYDEPSRRIEDVKALYESQDRTEVLSLLSKYDITHVVIGKLEREKYPALTEEIISSVAFPAFSAGETTVWEIR